MIRNIARFVGSRRASSVEPARVSPQTPVSVYEQLGISLPPYARTGLVSDEPVPAQILQDIRGKDAEAYGRLQRACALARSVLDLGASLVAPGITTDAIDKRLEQAIRDAGAYPSPLNYRGFPKAVCTSVNEVLCHGIPDARPLRLGELINIDVTVFLDGFHGDCSDTFVVGGDEAASADALRLVRVTRECLARGIEACGPGVPIGAIASAVYSHARAAGLDVSANFCGHGIGRIFHSEPVVCHVPVPLELGRMAPGMVFTIEPILALGSAAHELWPDGWTAVTRDGSWAAQAEHTLIIREAGVEVLTG